MTDIPIPEFVRRLEENIASFDAEVAYQLSIGGERADLWDEIDVNVEDLRSLLADRAAQAERMARMQADAREAGRLAGIEEAAVVAWVKCVEHCAARDGQKYIGAVVGQGVAAAIRALSQEGSDA